MADPSLSSPSTTTVPSGNAAGFPWVQGRCPACKSASLFLAAEGYVTCSWLRCPNPCAPSEALGIEFPAAVKVDPVEARRQAKRNPTDEERDGMICT